MLAGERCCQHRNTMRQRFTKRGFAQPDTKLDIPPWVIALMKGSCVEKSRSLSRSVNPSRYPPSHAQANAAQRAIRISNSQVQRENVTGFSSGSADDESVL